MAIARGAKVAPRSELDARLTYYDPENRRALFKAQWEINEFLVDPSLEHVLRALRRKTRATFFFVTNGNPLDERVVELLAETAPVDLIVSLNTTDTALRQKMMHERSGQTARAGRALQLLAEHQIPFGVSLAAFPDLTRTHFNDVLGAAESAGAAFVRVNLPGHTREMAPDPPFDTGARWAEVVEWVQNARRCWRVPIVSIPSAYEANFHQSFCEGADLWGVVKNSPTSAAGLCAGDVITRLGQFDIRSRSELVSLAMLLRAPVDVEFTRGGRRLKTILADIPPQYPYLRPVFGKYLFPFGLVAAPSLGPRDALELGRIIEEAESLRPIVISSPLMVGAAQDLVRRYLPRWDERVRWVIAQNDYLGGNIRILDMATVGDLVRSLTQGRPDAQAHSDLIVVPSSGFNSQGRDIVGRHWSDLGSQFEVAVVPLSCNQFVF